MQIPAGRAFPDLAALSIGQLRTLARHLCVRPYQELDAQELRRKIETNVRQETSRFGTATSVEQAKP
jgi:hypothetical protein